MPTGIRTCFIFLRMKNWCWIGKANFSLPSSESNMPMINNLCLQWLQIFNMMLLIVLLRIHSQAQAHIPLFSLWLNLKQMILLVCLIPMLNIKSLVHPSVVWLQGTMMGARYYLFQMIQPSCTWIKFILLVFPLPKGASRKIFLLISFRKYGKPITAWQLRS